MNIAILGLGIIGSIWAKNLIADGHKVRCWNRTPRDFPNFYVSIQETVECAEAIFVVVADPPAVAAVLDQIRSALRPRQLVIQSSTISAQWTLRFAEQVCRSGAFFLEAPFTGSKPAAEQRQTVFYLGGELEVIEMARPILQSLSSTILHVGRLGTASTLKLAMNLNIAGIAQALCESLTLCRAAGITDEVYFEALSCNASRSALSDLKMSKLRQRDYNAQFSLKHMAKDLRLALETAESFSLSLRQTAHLKKLYDQGLAVGWKEDDFIGLVRLLETK